MKERPNHTPATPEDTEVEQAMRLTAAEQATIGEIALDEPEASQDELTQVEVNYFANQWFGTVKEPTYIRGSKISISNHTYIIEHVDYEAKGVLMHTPDKKIGRSISFSEFFEKMLN